MVLLSQNPCEFQNYIICLKVKMESYLPFSLNIGANTAIVLLHPFHS